LLEWSNLRESSLKFMSDFEILISPPCSNTAPKPQNSGFLDYSYASYFNLLGWPAAVVRVGKTASGLPKGVQIVGRPWKEHEVLAVASLLERKLGGWKRDFPETNLIGVPNR
jgi:amidase